jgi:hypothetical protein
MSKTPQPGKYYPSPSKTGPLHDDFRLLFDYMYKQQSENASLKSQLEEAKKKHADLEQQVANGPSNTKINGLNVIATTPAQGNTIRWDNVTNQWIFGA